MVPPVSIGTILRSRYLIQQILGQGGFGRTYLALDQERFNEPCVLKEFVVPYQDGALVEKSKALFQREASILYQIQHPQIPRFWAAFEDEQRLFLVQDYVEGETYRRLLTERKQQGKTFSEAEVLHFLGHMLPVLTYIHDRDIVHRDITPENIILQTQVTTELDGSAMDAGLPVLIDFGAVKEATSHWPLMSTATRVGKVGYAPPEQLQTGKVYPNSDLYALAATAMALLTGKEPQSLLDSQTLSWRWQPYATISEELGRILQKMLAVYPGDRYLSASEVLAELQPLLDRKSESTLLPALPGFKTPPFRRKNRESSGQREEPLITYSLPSGRAKIAHSDHPEPIAFGHSHKFGKGAQLGVAAGILVVLGIATPVLWRIYGGNSDPNNEVWVSGTRMPQSEASRILESQTNSALKSPVDTNSESSPLNNQPLQALAFPAGKTSTIVQGRLPDNATQPYTLTGTEGQIMTASLEGAGVTMNLLRANQEAIDAAAYQTRSWTGVLPASEQYQLQVVGSGTYTLEVSMTPLSRPTQEQTQRVSFAKGSSGTTVTGQIAPRQLQRYLVKAKRGQILALKILQGDVNLSAIAPNGQRIGGSATNSKNWQGRLPIDGDYVIEVSSSSTGDYALSLEVF